MSYRSWRSRRTVALWCFFAKLPVNTTARQKAFRIIFRVAHLGNLVLRLVAILSVIMHPAYAPGCTWCAVVCNLAFIAIARNVPVPMCSRANHKLYAARTGGGASVESQPLPISFHDSGRHNRTVQHCVALSLGGKTSVPKELLRVTIATWCWICLRSHRMLHTVTCHW